MPCYTFYILKKFQRNFSALVCLPACDTIWTLKKLIGRTETVVANSFLNSLSNEYSFWKCSIKKQVHKMAIEVFFRSVSQKLFRFFSQILEFWNSSYLCTMRWCHCLNKFATILKYNGRFNQISNYVCIYNWSISTKAKSAWIILITIKVITLYLHITFLIYFSIVSQIMFLQ